MLSNLLPYEFQSWLAAWEGGTSDEEIHRLKTANVDWQTQLENFRSQLEKQLQLMQKAELEICTLRGKEKSMMICLTQVEESNRVAQRDVDACRAIIKDHKNKSDAA